MKIAHCFRILQSKKKKNQNVRRKHILASGSKGLRHVKKHSPGSQFQSKNTKYLMTKKKRFQPSCYVRQFVNNVGWYL